YQVGGVKVPHQPLNPYTQNRICRPEQIGLDQREIDWYYEYAIACVEGRAMLDSSAIDAIAMEVKQQKYGGAAILLPGSELR
ncbi:hypothetical protein, partial [Pseudomonas aeruginosa]